MTGPELQQAWDEEAAGCRIRRLRYSVPARTRQGPEPLDLRGEGWLALALPLAAAALALAWVATP